MCSLKSSFSKLKKSRFCSVCRPHSHRARTAAQSSSASLARYVIPSVTLTVIPPITLTLPTCNQTSDPPVTCNFTHLMRKLAGCASCGSRPDHQPSKVLWSAHSFPHQVDNRYKISPGPWQMWNCHSKKSKIVYSYDLAVRRRRWLRCLVWRMPVRSPTRWPTWGTIQTISGPVWNHHLLPSGLFTF